MALPLFTWTGGTLFLHRLRMTVLTAAAVRPMIRKSDFNLGLFGIFLVLVVEIAGAHIAPGLQSVRDAEPDRQGPQHNRGG